MIIIIIIIKKASFPHGFHWLHLIFGIYHLFHLINLPEAGIQCHHRTIEYKVLLVG